MAQGRSGGEALGASYRLAEPLGSGAIGEVWRVDVPSTGESLAAKLLRPEHAADPTIVERFVRERSVLLALRHPSIVRVRDLVVEGSQLAIVMDLVTGGSGRDLLQRHGTLTSRDALTLTAETLDGLGAAHALGVVHRDVKPDNVLLDGVWEPGRTGAVRVTDFGIATVLADRDRTTTGLLGTPQYMAPESISSGVAGPAADVYGAGVLLYELLSGRTPFAGPGSDFTVAYRHVTSQPPELDVPPALWVALDGLLAKDPAARPSAADAAARLRRLAETLPAAPPLAPATPPDSFAPIDRPATVVRGFSPTPEDLPASGAPTAVGTETAAGDTSPREEEPELAPSNQATVIRPLIRPRGAAAPVSEAPPRRRFVRPAWLTDRALGFGALGVVLVAAIVVGAVVLFPSARSRPAASQNGAAAATAFEQDRALPTGLSVTRKASYDRDSGTVTLTLTYSAQAAALTGPLLEVVPAFGTGGDCPPVAWSGESVTGRANQPSVTGIDVQCGWSLGGLTIPAGGQVTVSGTMPAPATALASGTQSALDRWLQGEVAATTKAIDDTTVTGTSFPVQRLQGVQVETPARAVSQTTLPVTLVPVWPNGPDELDPLYRSPSTGSPSQLLDEVAGGEKGVRFADGCSGALAVSSDGLVVTALSVAPNCTVRAVVGNFTDLQSEPFGITTRE